MNTTSRMKTLEQIAEEADLLHIDPAVLQCFAALMAEQCEQCAEIYGGSLLLRPPPPPKQPTRARARFGRVRERPRQPRFDWFRVITHLERSGYTQRDIAARLGMSKGWVIHLKDSPGAEPRCDDGLALLDLWCDAMDKPLCDAPREKGMTYG